MAAKKRRKGVLESFLDQSFDDTPLQKARELADEITADQPPTLPTDQPTELTDSVTDQQTDRRTVRQIDRQIDRPIDGQIDRPIDGRIDGQADQHIDGQIDRQMPFFWITERQAKVLSFLLRRKDRITTLNEIVQRSGVPYGTVRASIRKLVSEKCISQPVRYRRGQFHGITYTVNEPLCSDFKGWESDRQIDGQIDGQINRQTDGVTDGMTDTLCSSSLNTTTKETLKNHPELGYWRQKGLTQKQMDQWVKFTGGLENLVQSLCHCRFEMVDLGLEESKPVENVFGWFYRILEKTGSYPQPKGYKTFQQKQVEEERRIVEERKKHIQELEALSREKYELEMDEKFWTMMNDQKGDLYKQCFELLNNFAKKQKGRAFEQSMRVEFDKMMDEKGYVTN